MREVKAMELERITADPNICFGKACIRGLRIPVHLIVDLVAVGKSPAEIIEDYPELEPEDIKQALEYAAELVREGVAVCWTTSADARRRVLRDTLDNLKEFHRKVLETHGGKPLPDSVSDLDDIRDGS